MTPDQRYGTLSATVLVLCAALLVLAGLAHCGAAPSPAAASCIERYQACGLVSASMSDYVTCRTAVDKDCLPAKGAAQ